MEIITKLKYYILVYLILHMVTNIILLLILRSIISYKMGYFDGAANTPSISPHVTASLGDSHIITYLFGIFFLVFGVAILMFFQSMLAPPGM